MSQMTAISYVLSKETALPALPWPAVLHPGLLGEGACGPNGLQDEQAEPQDGSQEL